MNHTLESLIVRQPLRRFTELASAADGVDTRALKPGDTLVVETCHSRYTLRLDDPQGGRALGLGSGSHLVEEAPVRLLGATLTGRGTVVKSGWVLLGYKLVVAVPEGEMMTSLVRRIWINGSPLTDSATTH